MGKKGSEDYTSSYWYQNNCYSLGSQWLIRSIEKLDIKQNYVLVSLSANAGYYEKEVYEKHAGSYNPTYYIGDRSASTLKDPKVESFDQFYYIQGDNDVVTMDITIIPVKADILLDTKGALWYALQGSSSSKEQLIQLLEQYSQLLNNSGILLLDFYYTHPVKYYFQKLYWNYKKPNKKPTILKCFGELSTYYYLVNLYGRKTINTLLKPLNIRENLPNYPLSKRMNTAYLSKNDLQYLIEITEHIPQWKFVLSKVKMKIEYVLLIVVLCALLIGNILFAFGSNHHANIGNEGIQEAISHQSY